MVQVQSVQRTGYRVTGLNPEKCKTVHNTKKQNTSAYFSAGSRSQLALVAIRHLRLIEE